MTPYLIALYRVKNEARWIAESLARTLQVADDAIVFDDHSTDDTVKQICTFSDADYINSPYNYFDEARDKTHLLHDALTHDVDWILFLDGDEVLTPSAVKEVKQIVDTRVGGIYTFRMAYLWDSYDQERVDNHYANFHVPRLFSVFDQEKKYLKYVSTKHGGNLHCGQVPAGLRARTYQACSPIKHYGYMWQSDREKKHTFYNSIDTEAGRLQECNYDHILGKPTKHAPDSIKLRKFVDE